MEILYNIISDNNKIKRKKIYKGNLMKLNPKRNIFNKLLELVIILILFPLFFSKEFRYKLTTLQLYSEIKLTIKGKGNQYILSKGINRYLEYEGPLPTQLLINGSSQIINNKMIYNLKDEYNNVTLIWNSPLSNTDYMFYEVKNITKIIISHFDSTELNSIKYMFYGIELLTSIDLSNFDTSLVTDFSYLFYHCILLESIDLSNFKTINAVNMENMFFECESLISLDLSNFKTSNVENMGYMFCDCESLISLDLSNFETSNVEYMDGMIAFCSSLIYLNLKSFTEKSLSSLENIFYNIEDNILYCINKNKAPQIISEIKEYSSNNDCSDTCFLQSSIVLINEKKCVSCSKYKYNNECVQSCPKRTRISLNNNYSCIDLHCQNFYNYNQTDCLDEMPQGYFLNDSDLKTIDKCYYNYSGKYFSKCINDNNDLKCWDSYNQNIIEELKFCFVQDLCVYCKNDTGYYPFYNQTLFNDNTFTDCYKDLEGYFLDYDNAYKPCFNTCKTCSKDGNETNNNCIECEDNYVLLNDSSNDVLNNCYIECGENYYYFDSLNKYHCTDIKKCPDNYKLIKEKNKCIDNCTKDDVFHFEFNNSCLRECPPNHTEINNICLKVPDTVIDTNLPTINIDNVIATSLPTINSDTAIDTNLPTINSDNVIDTKLPTINIDNVIDTSLPTINSDTAISTNLPTINSDNVISTNLQTINTDTVIGTNLPTINSDTVIGTNLPTINSDNVISTNLPTINTDTVIGTNLPTINSDNDIGTNLPTINSDTVIDTNSSIINSDNVIETNLPTINSDTVIGTNSSIINSDIVIDTNLPIINLDTIIDTDLQTINSDTVIGTNSSIINSDTVIGTNLPTINSDHVIDTNLQTINSDNVINSILHKINSDTVIDTNLQLINSDSVIDTNIQKININEKGECPKDFPYKLQNDIECITECKASDVFKGICIINNKDPTIIDVMINKTRNEIINHEMDELLKDVIGGKKENLITVQGNAIYTLTTSDNQKNNKQKNESTIYLGDFENKLKDHYNTSTNETLLIFKIDIFENCSDNPIIEYEIKTQKYK